MANRRDQIKLTIEEIDDFVAEHWCLVLGTTGRDGHPHMTTLSYGLLRDQVVVASFRQAQKVTNVRRDPRVSLLIEENQDDYAQTRGILVAAEAILSEDVDTVLEASKAIVAQRRRVLGDDVFIPDSVELSAAKRCVLTFKPTKMVSWDHTRLSGTY